jgi:DNA-binding CsgD family transcriptional regulator
MFSSPSVKTVSEALLHLHRSGTRKDFPSRLFACLKTAFLGDFFSYHECTEYPSERIELFPATAVNTNLLTGWISQRPEIRGVYQYSSYPGILHLCAPLLCGGPDLHHELIVLLGQQHHLRMTICDGRSRVDAVVSRSSRSFSDGDYRMLESLRPHLIQSYKSGNQSSFSTEAIEVANVAFLITDWSGKIRYATDRARRLMRKYFDAEPELILPGRIQRWLKERARLDNVVPSKELRIDFGRTSLSVRMMSGDGNSAPYRLLVREIVQTVDAELLLKLGLTRKEAEVLFWASQGKSNGDIAIILTSKVRTVAKHLERVFAKLMVENRTSAVRAALDRIYVPGGFEGGSSDSTKRTAMRFDQDLKHSPPPASDRFISVRGTPRRFGPPG